jgi:hypothetical protein
VSEASGTELFEFKGERNQKEKIGNFRVRARGVIWALEMFISFLCMFAFGPRLTIIDIFKA